MARNCPYYKDGKTNWKIGEGICAAASEEIVRPCVWSSTSFQECDSYQLATIKARGGSAAEYMGRRLPHAKITIVSGFDTVEPTTAAKSSDYIPRPSAKCYSEHRNTYVCRSGMERMVGRALLELYYWSNHIVDYPYDILPARLK